MFIFLQQSTVNITMLFYIRIRLTIILLTHACCSRQQDGEIFNFVRLSPTDAENTGLSNVDAGDGLLAQHMVCKRCGSVIQERPYARVQDGVVWLPRRCQMTSSIRKGSFFKASHLPLRKLMDLAYFRSMDVSNTDLQYQVHV